ncbi:hypothetical protein GO730_17345 [Spirosoma sp. HMF3257]|nr:hypothetical protein [Spirosoma telluris]
MPIPKKIPIMREKNYHTHFLGKYDNGTQFFGYETFFFPGTYPNGKDWEKFRREYVVLYLFDEDGRFIDFEYWYAGTTSERQDTTAKLEQMVSSRGPYEFSDIEVELFQTEIDGEVFGLVADEEGETVELMPSSTIAFSEPWNGEYYT